MLTLYVRNIKTDKDDMADYTAIVMVNSQVIATAKIRGHYRPDGWRALIQRIISEAIDEEG